MLDLLATVFPFLRLTAWSERWNSPGVGAGGRMSCPFPVAPAFGGSVAPDRRVAAWSRFGRACARTLRQTTHTTSQPPYPSCAGFSIGKAGRRAERRRDILPELLPRGHPVHDQTDRIPPYRREGARRAL